MDQETFQRVIDESIGELQQALKKLNENLRTIKDAQRICKRSKDI